MINSQPTINLAWWRFLLPFCLQFAVILTVPAKSAYTYYFGTEAIVQTIPVDPYDLLRGYSQTLRYDISNTSNLQKLPGGENVSWGKIFYLVLEINPAAAKLPPPPSRIIKITPDLPQNLPANQVALKGKVEKYDRISYGLETYYMPESQRNTINREIADLQRNSEDKIPFVVEIKVDRWGNSVPVSLWIENKKYRF